MSLKVWQKRWVKVRGSAHQIFSYILLRHTVFNVKKLKKRIRHCAIDKLHVGCGNVFIEDWLNIRYEAREEYGRLIKRDEVFFLNYNLLKPWPVIDNSIKHIAGSHIIEHLDLNQGIAFLRKCYQALTFGGTIRLSCPDLELYARNYVSRNREFFGHKLIRQWCAVQSAETPGEIFIAKAYDSGLSHKWFYDFESLAHVLQAAGFKEIRRVARLEGKTPELAKIELKERELETIYVEAVK